MTDSAANIHFDRLTGSLGMRELAISAVLAMSPGGTMSATTSYDPTAEGSSASTPIGARESTQVIATRVAEFKLEKEICCLEFSPDGTALSIVERTRTEFVQIGISQPSPESFGDTLDGVQV
jgi:hypothetical protein